MCGSEWAKSFRSRRDLARHTNRSYKTNGPNRMIIKIGFDIQFDLPAPTPMILMLYVHPSRQADLRAPEKIVAEPGIPHTDFNDLYAYRCARLLAPAGEIRFTLETFIEDSGQPDEQQPDAI